MEKIFKLFYNSLEKPINVKGILINPNIEEDKIVWKYENPNNLSFSTYILETYIEDLFCDFCEQAEFTKVPSFPIFWDIDSPVTLYINEELKSEIEKLLLEIKDISLWLNNNSNLECKSQMDYWKLSQEFSETIFLEVRFNLYDIYIDNESVSTIKASKWIQNYYYKDTAFLEGQQLLDEIEYIISEEETMYDESYMNIAVSIDYICPKDNHINKLNKNDMYEEEKVILYYEELEIYINEDDEDPLYLFCIEEADDFFITDEFIIEYQENQDIVWISFDEETREAYRVIKVPIDITIGERVGSNHSFNVTFDTLNEGLNFLKNLKTISFKKLKKLAGYPHNENLCYFNTKKNISTDNTKVEIVITYHENGQIKEEIETVNNKLHGIYKQYHNNGQLSFVNRFENGSLVDGVIDSFDENGMLIRTVEVKNANKNGPFKEFYPSGIIKKEGEYKDDEVIGKSIEYFEDGSIKDVSEEY